MALVLEGMVVWYFLLSLDEWFGGCLFVPVSYVALQNSGNSPASVSCSFFICYPEFWIFFFFLPFLLEIFPFFSVWVWEGVPSSFPPALYCLYITVCYFHKSICLYFSNFLHSSIYGDHPLPFHTCCLIFKVTV